MTPKSIRIIRDLIGRELLRNFRLINKPSRAKAYYEDLVEAERELNELVVPMKSKLVEGMIPANTECPFTDKCPMHKMSCRHLGTDHPCNYSCASARAFDKFEDK
jgi:hypothetical protein